MPILFVDQLTVLDCAYLDPARGLVGESWIVDLELEGALDAQSMVLDFSDCKRQIKHAIDASLDHRLLLPMDSPSLRVATDTGDAVALRYDCAHGLIEHRSPACALGQLSTDRIDSAAVEAALLAILAQALAPAAIEARVKLRTEVIAGPYYHYVHGLKKHRGACQRIAHGHRSAIEVQVNGMRDAALEQQVAKRWQDIYVGSAEDVRARHAEAIEFGYRSAEGDYWLRLPSARCSLLDSDSTVECIAAYWLDQLAPLRADAQISVRAYEGVHKGAIARN